MEEYLGLFQNLAFPVAMCVVLLVAIGIFTKKLLALVESMMNKHDEERKKIFDYMRTANAEQNAIIKENTETNKKVVSLLILVHKELKANTPNK